MNLSFRDKVVVITGGSTGIGAEMANGFSAAGAKVVVSYLSSEQKANDVVSYIKENGGEAISVRADVTSTSDIKKLYETTIQKFGRIDVLINNAGGMVERCPFEELSEEAWDQVYNLNVKSIFLATKEVIPIMKEQGGGAIINTASVAARNGGGPGAIHYASAKGAVMTLTKGMAKELLPYNIRVNGINPGVISTPFHEKFTPDHIRSNFLNGIPMGREGLPTEIVGAVLFLASDYASYIIGEHIEINGGQWMD